MYCYGIGCPVICLVPPTHAITDSRVMITNHVDYAVILSSIVMCVFESVLDLRGIFQGIWDSGMAWQPQAYRPPVGLCAKTLVREVS